MYDKFEANIQLAMQEIVFQPKRYEIWMNARLVDSGKTIETVVFQPFKSEGKTLMKVNIKDISLHTKIMSSFDFDIFFTHTERLMLLTLPENKEKNDCAGLNMFRLNMSPTRIAKSFAATEPYCSSIFLVNGVLNKITFSFNYPERLIEFYSDDNDFEIESDFSSALNMLK
jgi:hypothetical protein